MKTALVKLYHQVIQSAQFDRQIVSYVNY